MQALTRAGGLGLFEQRHSQHGLTLMECVVAIAVVALTGALITPPLFLAAATRVQNRRAEQALQIAQGEIDRIRTLVEQGQHDQGDLPAAVPREAFPVDAPNAVVGVLRSVDATCNTYDGATIPTTELLPIDVDGDCDTDFLLQSFRTGGGRLVDNKPSEFEVGVRVYASNVLTPVGGLRELRTEQASLKFTSGEGSQREFPLAVLYTSATWDGSGVALYCYHEAAVCDE